MSEPDLLSSIEPPAEAPGETSNEGAPSGQLGDTDAAKDADENFATASATDKEIKSGERFLTPRFQHANVMEKFYATSDDEFDWAKDDSVILQEQLALAVYRNRYDAIVIRQEARSGDFEDQFVYLRDHEAAAILIATLQRELKGRR